MRFLATDRAKWLCTVVRQALLRVCNVALYCIEGSTGANSTKGVCDALATGPAFALKEPVQSKKRSGLSKRKKTRRV